MPQPSDKMLILKLYNRHEKKSSHFDKPRTSTSSFIVKHFADRVIYESVGFVEKNMDSVIPEHLSLLKASEVCAIYSTYSSNQLMSKSSIFSVLNYIMYYYYSCQSLVKVFSHFYVFSHHSFEL